MSHTSKLRASFEDTEVSTSTDGSNFQVIELHMMDSSRFYPLSLVSSASVRLMLYPLTVVKTRLQIQKRSDLYKGTLDAFVKIGRNEGLLALYKGYWVNTLQIFSMVLYIATYENTRHFLLKNTSLSCAFMFSSASRASVAGGCATFASTSIIIPFDVISQHLMVLGNVQRQASPMTDSLNIAQKCSAILHSQNKNHLRSRFEVVSLICRRVYEIDGWRGLYRGYWASMMCYIPNSLCFWYSYLLYAETIAKNLSDKSSNLTASCMAAPLAGLTCAVATNPLDLYRARLQVQRDTMPTTLKRLWTDEGLSMLWKGLSARATMSATFSLFSIFGYETIKRLSVSADYKHHVRW